MNDFADRDTSVIPWLPQYSRPSRPVSNPCKIIKLLSARERIGMKSYCTRVGSLSEGILVSNDALSGTGAWNRRRMQNMVLAIGPGTPASCVLSLITPADNNESESYDDDEEEVDTSVEMLESNEEDHQEEDENSDNDVVLEEDTLSDGSSEPEVGNNTDDTPYRNEVNSTAKNHIQDKKYDNDRRDAEEEIARHLAARPIEKETIEEHHNIHDTGQRSPWTCINRVRYTAEGQASNPESENENDEFSHDTDSLDVSQINESRAHRTDQVIEFIERQIMRQHERHRQSQQYTSVMTQVSQQYKREVARSIRHGGCINTASWLDCGWRISTVSHEDANCHDSFYDNMLFVSSSHSSNDDYSKPDRRKLSSKFGLAVLTSQSEYPTQILTSGDDHVVKFWDVSQSMGRVLPGGSATIAPFSSSRVDMKPTSELITKWRNYVGAIDDDTSAKHNIYLPGIVHPLLTLSTGHRGNVFHATPVPCMPGKVLTCAADGFLRLTDVEINATSSPAARTRDSLNSVGEASAIIISPEYQSENGESEHVYRYRESSMCFSHHFLNTNVGLVCSERGLLHFDLRLPPNAQKRGSLIEELSSTCKSCCVLKETGDSDSTYVFAGGTGTDVALYDLRVTGSPSSQAIQRYRPTPLRGKSSVSISGIELSRNKKELLVSYESDQCYTFPVFPNTSLAGPSIADINTSRDNLNNGAEPVPELAQYGGHLNCLTFLKTAKFAGPNDEYICTGSDSGHAWVYDKQSGSVAAFLRADRSTCNGILPHPSLPYFITYGIDSTVKLWRATLPVDDEVDDSDSGRFISYQRCEYIKSITVDKWKSARKRNPVDLDNEDLSFFPDETPVGEVTDSSTSLGFMGLLFSRARAHSDPPFIGNDLANLENEIKKNYFTCARSGMNDDIPVKSGLSGLKRRVALIKLRYHSDRIGLNWDCNVPWNYSFKEHVKEEAICCNEHSSYGALADLVPNPSDWMPFHALMSNPPLGCGTQFSKYHKQFYQENYVDKSIHPTTRAYLCNNTSAENDNESAAIDCTVYDNKSAWNILYATVFLLKEAGNAALKNFLTPLAARYYDKAILYCALAYMEFPVGTSSFLAQHQITLSENAGWECRWTNLLVIFLKLRLNLALCCLKSDMHDTKLQTSVFQAKMALKELKPFVKLKGGVMIGKKLERTRLDEPHSTFIEAMAIQSKAYFRLGSAQLLLSEFEDAIESFEQSINASNESSPDSKPDPMLLRKLQEAKLAKKRYCNSERKKFKFAFESNQQEKNVYLKSRDE